ncbi:major facilitator superfamily domain-containing protein [Dactylonectria estremocensis]|uniref:Major facilitator superfamily domain-containing protein n=1 Tax=Dactylonectria estremocensis TaxID=1079267 RepID=A0A9P9IXZ5_9HYPO|nr:major facilitator superfamily domain-containing protein [Dactylonectria estremocensis]
MTVHHNSKGESTPPVQTRDLSDESPNGLDLDSVEAERRLVRKLDLHIIPLIMTLYLFSFLDRVNIGNARLYSLEEDLGLSPEQFQVSVSILFVTYLLFEVPSNLVLKLFTPRRWIAFIAAAWGIIATLMGLVNSYGALLACRLLLGAVEAGLFPGLTVYLTFFYTKRELALRVGYLFVSAAVAGGLGGLLAYGIGHMDGLHGMSGWRWIMLIEGIPSFAVGVVTYFVLPNDPETAYFLDDAERALMRARHAREYGNTASSREFNAADMVMAFKDWKVWAFCVAQFGVDTMLYGFSTFLPTIINDLGEWTTAEVQLLTVPCYFLGAVAYMSTAYLSDRMQRRGLFCVLFGAISVVGYGILLADVSSGAHYFGCFLVAGGLYVVVGLPLAWLPTNSPRYGKRTTGTGMQLTWGNAAGIMSAFIYPVKDKPRYVRGHAVTLSMVGLGTVIYAFLWFWYRRENQRRAAGEMKEKYRGMAEEELVELGDESPHYRYTI